MTHNVFLIIITAIFGALICYAALVTIYKLLVSIDRISQSGGYSLNVTPLLKGMAIILVLVLALFIGMQAVDYISGFCGYAARSYLLGQVIGLSFVPKSSAYCAYLARDFRHRN